ncbi:MAG: ChbG/HpnK family deacetylase [Candidatus Colwellbacteria bacterium]
MSNLRIIADDLGLAECVNDGIALGLREGWLGGASLMANGEAFDDAVKRVGEADKENIGAHLVLVEEKPLSKPGEVSSLVGTDGLLHKNHKAFFFRYVLGLISEAEIRKEFRAQLEIFLEAGIRPAFINSHQHLHLLPGIMVITIDLAKELEIPYIRIVSEPFSGGAVRRGLQLVFLNFLSWLAKKKIKKAGLLCNDIFVGFVNAGNLNEGDIQQAKSLAGKYPDKIIELGCHPGYENEELRRKYEHWGDFNWLNEIRILES